MSKPADADAVSAEIRKLADDHTLQLVCGHAINNDMLRVLQGTIHGLNLARTVVERAARGCLYD